MKKIWLVCALLIVLANVVSIGTLREKQKNEVGETEEQSDRELDVIKKAGKRLTTDDARNIAADRLGASCDDLVFYMSYLRSVGGREYYDVECAYGGMDHRFEIDAYTGAVLKEEHGL